jgi:hypothetical protein
MDQLTATLDDKGSEPFAMAKGAKNPYITPSRLKRMGGDGSFIVDAVNFSSIRATTRSGSVFFDAACDALSIDGLRLVATWLDIKMLAKFGISFSALGPWAGKARDGAPGWNHPILVFPPTLEMTDLIWEHALATASSDSFRGIPKVFPSYPDYWTSPGDISPLWAQAVWSARLGLPWHKGVLAGPYKYWLYTGADQATNREPRYPDGHLANIAGVAHNQWHTDGSQLAMVVRSHVRVEPGGSFEHVASHVTTPSPIGGPILKPGWVLQDKASFVRANQAPGGAPRAAAQRSV